jgi:hypothetical protein
MSTKEIASFIGKESNRIDLARYLLMKKLELDRKDEFQKFFLVFNLVNIIQGL